MKRNVKERNKWREKKWEGKKAIQKALRDGREWMQESEKRGNKNETEAKKRKERIGELAISGV